MTAPVYATEHVRIYGGDARVIIHDVADESFGVVLTDPPYVYWAHIAATEDVLDIEKEVRWQTELFVYTLQWFPVVRRMRPGVAWFFADPHYVGVYIRIARYLKWPMVGWWPAARGDHEEGLIAFSDEYARPENALIMEALKLNSYGQAKRVEMLSILLGLSPVGAVLDPFCGSGTTLEAALLSSRTAVGIELDDKILAGTVGRMRAIRSEQCPYDGTKRR